MIDVLKVEALSNFTLRLVFSDGTSGNAPMRPKLEAFEPFRPLLDEAVFRTAEVEDGVVTWPNGLDIATERLYALAHGLPDPDTLQQANDNELTMSLNELRRLSDTNQVTLANELRVTQGAVSRLENSASDANLGTLRRYLAALGWELEVIASRGDQRIRLRGL